MAVVYDIGPGVKQAMKDNGDEPRSHEQFVNDHITGMLLFSETQGRDAVYRYTPQDGVKRLPFDAE